MSDGPAIKETIQLEVPAAKVEANLLGAMLGQLKQVDEVLASINAKYAGFQIGTPRGIGELTQKVKKAYDEIQKLGGSPLNADALAKKLFPETDPAVINTALLRMRDAKARVMNEFRLDANEFRNISQAAQAFAQVEGKLSQQKQAFFKDALHPPVTDFTNTSAGGKIAGHLTLEIPAAQVQASVLGEIKLLIPGAQIVGVAGAGASSAEGRGSSAGGGAQTSKSSTALAAELRHQASLEADAFRAASSGLAGGDASGLAASKLKYAAQLNALITPEMQEDESRAVQRAIEKVQSRASRLEAEAHATFAGPESGAISAAEAEASAESEASYRRSVEAAAARRTLHHSKVQSHIANLHAQQQAIFAQATSGVVVPGQVASNLAPQQPYYRLVQATAQQSQNQQQKVATHIANLHAKQLLVLQAVAAQAGIPANAAQAAATMLATAGVTGLPRPPVIPPPVIPKSGAGSGGGYLSQLGSKFIGLTQYGLAATALYKGAELGGYAGSRAVEIEAQEKRLSQVYSGQGGSVRALTDDILRLAAAHGRETQEAMESGVQWSRLGLSRVEINQLVATSLKAANVAELTAGEATESLSKLMLTYKLNAGQLNDTLGMLNATSNKSAISTRELLAGVMRAAPVASQSGMDLPELAGLVTSIVQKGATGSQAGNAVKTLLTRLGDPAHTKYLETATGNKEFGGLPAPEQLGEIWQAYAKLNDEERRHLTTRLAGATQNSRITAGLMDYIGAEQKAIDMQRNLNSAEQENALILGSVKSQWQALKAEFDRAVFTGAGGGPNGGVGGVSPMSVVANSLRGWRGVMSTVTDLAQNAQRSTGLSKFSPEKRFLIENILSGPVAFAGNLLHASDSIRDSYADDARQTANNAQASAREARLFKRLAAAYPGAREDVQSDIRTRFGLTGDASDVVRQLKGRGLRSEKEAGVEQRDALRQQQMVVAIDEEKIVSLEKQKQTASGERLVEIENQINAAMHERDQALGKATELTLDLEDVTAQIPKHVQDAANAIAQMAERVKSLHEAFQQLAPTTFSGRTGNEIELLEQHKKELENTIQALEASHADTKLVEKYEEQLPDLNAAITAKKSRGPLDALMDDRAVAAKMSRAEFEGAGAGFSPGEQLLDRQRQLQAELAGLRATAGRTFSVDSDRPTGTDNQLVRGLEAANALTETREKIQMRIVQLAQEEKQLIIEGRKEFERSLLTATPGQLLQKLAAFRAVQSGQINSGSFFAAGPEFRQNVVQLEGGEGVIRNRREQNILNPHRRTIEDVQNELRKGQHDADFWRRGLNQNALGAGKPVLDVEVVERAKAASNLVGFNLQLSRATPNLQIFADMLVAATERMNRLAVNAPPGKVNSLPAANGRATGVGATGTW